jgi:hypothetical protein
VDHSTNPSTRKANLVNFFLLWTQTRFVPFVTINDAWATSDVDESPKSEERGVGS